jgi:uncharacterized protein (TIGR01570 family)
MPPASSMLVSHHYPAQEREAPLPPASTCNEKAVHFSHVLLAPPLTELVTGTIFGQKTEQGHLHLVIQMEPKSLPFIVLVLALSTNFFRKAIVKEPLQLFLTCVKKDTSMSIW